MTDPIARLNEALEDRYRIARELGEGGMATVYLAEDVKHKREVALKVLKPELAAVVGAERFLAEIEVTAGLQHPHILPLFDSGEAAGFLFYVMPFVEGETLRDRLDRERQLAVEEAVALTRKLSSALAYAHERGVVHRDIKPANILLSRGEPLIADFGIALALGAAGGGRLTETGLSVGTPYYMSPEQATGDLHVGPPSDIYALGCVLYELLVGEPPHGGATAQAVLGKIIAGDPVAPTRQRASIPANVDAAIRKSLERLPADRFSDAEAFGRALGDPGFRHGEEVAAVADLSMWKPLAIAALIVAMGSLGWAGWVTVGDGDEVRDIGLPHEAPMQFGRTNRAFAVAPDASFMVYEARSGPTVELWYRSLNGLEARPIRGTEGANGIPLVSPDGSRVAFAADGELRVVGIDGGSVTPVGEAVAPFGGEWLADDRILYSDSDGRFLRWVDPQTGPVQEMVFDYCLFPQLLPSGETVLCSGGAWKFATARDVAEPSRIRYWTRADESGSALRGSGFRMVDGDYLVYTSIDGSLMAAPILSLDSLTVGRPVALVTDLRRESYAGVGQWDIVDNGTLVYASGLNAEVGRLVRVTQDGAVEALNVDEAVHLRFRESPDGRRLATVVEVVQGQELRIYDLSSGSYETLEEAFWVGAPVWSPDGSSLVYTMNDEENFFEEHFVYIRRIDSPEGPRVLLSDPTARSGFQPATFLAPDSLLIGVGVSDRAAVLVDPTTDPPRVDTLDINPLFLALSPDRRWLAWQGQGSPGIQVQPWPAMDRRYPVSQTGIEPQWLSDGQLVYFEPIPPEASGSSGIPFWRVPMDPTSDSPVGEPALMIRDPRFADTPGWSHAPTSDGQVIYLQSPEENLGHYVRVVPGWVDLMKRAVDEANR